MDFSGAHVTLSLSCVIFVKPIHTLSHSLAVEQHAKFAAECVPECWANMLRSPGRALLHRCRDLLVLQELLPEAGIAAAASLQGVCAYSNGAADLEPPKPQQQVGRGQPRSQHDGVAHRRSEHLSSPSSPRLGSDLALENAPTKVCLQDFS